MRITNNHMRSDNENNFLPKSLLNVAMVWVCPPQFTCGNLNLPCKGFKRWRQWTDSSAKRTWDADSPSLALARRPLCHSASLLPQHYSACKQCRGLGTACNLYLGQPSHLQRFCVQSSLLCRFLMFWMDSYILFPILEILKLTLDSRK